MTDTPQNPSVSREELEQIFSGPAIFSNKVYSTISSAGMRLTFAENSTDGSPPIFRTAVLLSFPDVLELMSLLARQMSAVNIEKETPPEAFGGENG